MKGKLIFNELHDHINSNESTKLSRSIDLIFDNEIPIQIILHSDDTRIMVQSTVCNLAELTGKTRMVVINTLVGLNSFMAQNQEFTVGIDAMHNVLVFNNVYADDTTVHCIMKLASRCSSKSQNILNLLEKIISV